MTGLTSPSFRQALKLGRSRFSQRPPCPGSCREVALCHFPVLKLLFSAGWRLEVGRLTLSRACRQFPWFEISLSSVTSFTWTWRCSSNDSPENEPSSSLNPISGWIWKGCFQTRSRCHPSELHSHWPLAFKSKEEKHQHSQSPWERLLEGGEEDWCSLSHGLSPVH